MRALVVGAGIGGSTAALALSAAGWDVTVHEAHPKLAGSGPGAFLTLAPNGLLALEQVGAASVARSVGFELSTLALLDASGFEVAVRPMGEFRCLLWIELVAALHREVRQRGIPVLHDRRVESVSGREADVVVGADGLWSTLRRAIDPARPRYTGQRVFFGYTPGAVSVAGVSAAPGRFTIIRGSASVFGYTVSPSGVAYWFARVTDALGSDESPGYLLDRLRPDATPAAGLAAASGGRIRVTDAYDLPGVRRWRAGRLLLLGDAAHAAAPATGQGASMAMEDAVILAKALRDSDDVDAALALYERVRRPRVEANTEASARSTAGSAPGPGVETDIAAQLDWGRRLGG
ncbi:FAD-dependent oxidoreductase [Cryptosporangium phraense]|uniref:FAD-dependent monooxygenase n=1 Tax=Cryptosporangium phraense TaxID=2593070 RepID=A0A545AXL6_9ACTN|nr:NAD(P)/FAD-dependent oxidoreductase [Cryptosporangium phraense]TQS46076.1 FAD-dependent monooxygenase [Cryptosporangium phraense]